MHLLVVDNAFWDEQVKTPASAWIAHRARSTPRSPKQSFALENIQGGAEIRGSSLGDPARRSAKPRRDGAANTARQQPRHLSTATGSKGAGKNAGGLKTHEQGGSELCFFFGTPVVVLAQHVLQVSSALAKSSGLTSVGSAFHLDIRATSDNCPQKKG